MVSGIVRPPALDMVNRDLLEAHLRRWRQLYDGARAQLMDVAQLPGDDKARVVIEDGGEIVPPPTNDLEVGEVSLPELVGRNDDACRRCHRHTRAGVDGFRLRQCEDRAQTDNGSSYISSDLAEWLKDRGMVHVRGSAVPSADPGQDRTLASDAQEPHSARELLPAWRSRGPDRALR
jgi:hypothetical protein